MVEEESSGLAQMPAQGRFRALAFSGGLDAIVQLGVAHALLVSSGTAPDAVVGVSVGAVNAAALAEILQAGCIDAQVDKLRKFLDSYLSVPREIVRSILPDTYEINAREPLKLIEQPIHFQEERDDRRQASRARWGLIYVMNKVFGLGFTVRALTLVTHCVLEIVAAANRTGMSRYATRSRHLFRLWFLSPRLLALAPTFWTLLLRASLNLQFKRGATAWGLLRYPVLRRIGRELASALAILASAILWTLSGLAPLLGIFWLALHLARWNPPEVLQRPWIPRLALLYLILWLLTILLVVLSFFIPALQRMRRRGVRRMLDRLLEHLALNDALGDSYALKQQLVDCFDREYYGKIEIEEVLKRASQGDTPDPLEPNPKRPKKTLGDYRCRKPAIMVGAVAAEIKTGDLSVLCDDVPVVDALLAATAYVPFFPAVEIAPTGLQKRFFISGGNISREAVGPLLDFIRNEKELDRVEAVDVYPVHRLLGGPGCDSDEGTAGLIQGALRALRLQRLRDATIEQRLTGLYSKVLRPGSGRVWVAGGRSYALKFFPW